LSILTSSNLLAIIIVSSIFFTISTMWLLRNFVTSRNYCIHAYILQNEVHNKCRIWS
jgi:hypothetical protein